MLVKTKLAMCGAAFTLMAVGSAATQAETVTRTYFFTAADLVNNQFVDGAAGTTAAGNGLFEGARLLRNVTNPTHANAARTFIEDQHNTFQTRWASYAQQNYTFSYFNLWGLDGRGINWGEDFKPLEWVSASAPAGWEIGYTSWEANGWGTPPAGALTTSFPTFMATNAADGISLTSPDESQVFSVTIRFDTDNAWWGADAQGAPNDLDAGLTMWFGGWLYGDGTWQHMYEGNLYAPVVPLPAAAWAGLVLMGGVVARKIRGRRRAE